MSALELPPADEALETAAVIGFGIARQALWSGDRCTWLDGMPVPMGENPAVSMLCGPDVYGGTAGVGWFLAQAARLTGDPLLRRTARAALRQAAERAEADNGPIAHGHYGGVAGIGAALVRAGRELGEEEPVAAGRRLLLGLPGEAQAPRQTDIISGLAGTIASLAIAAETLARDGALIERARSAAAALLALSERDERGGRSWPTMDNCRANLAGFGHGAAGIAHALLVLDALAPESALREAAAEAFAYEAGLFDPAQGNWPDHRLLPGYPQDQIFYPVAWCHGAAGILRSRLLAAGRGFDVAADIAAALAATAGETERALAAGQADFTLCHGVIGLADGLLDAVRAGHAGSLAPLAAAARFGIDAFHRPERPWPSGLPTREEAVGLMLGNAGIGHFYLRLADPGIESVLAPGASIARD